jgi:putative hydrolase
MKQFPILDQHSDLHVHSTFSDGLSTIEENVASAAGHGLHTLGLVDHVRRSTDWVPSFVDAVRALDGTAGLKILCGVEVKILDTAGTLDLPPDLPHLDYILIADHQMPRPDGPMSPTAVAVAVASGDLDAAQVIDDLVEATVASLAFYDRVILAHMFSILPKCGLGEDQVPEASLVRIAQATAQSGAIVEVNEKWACPSRRVMQILADEGVAITFSTDAHHEARVGRYQYVAGIADALGAVNAGPHSSHGAR